MKRTKCMDKEAIEEILSGAGHSRKMNRYNRFMHTLRTNTIEYSGSGCYCLKSEPQPVSLELQAVYSSGGGET